MYPLNAILIGSEQTLLPAASREILNRSLHIEAEFSNALEVINAFRRSTSEKRLLLLQMSSLGEIDILERLTSQFPGWPVIAFMDGCNPRELRGEVVVGLIRAGASQILGIPIQYDEFQTALERIATQYVYSFKKTKVIGVAGVTGGSGATTIALNLASEIAHQQGVRCVLVELSLRMGVVASVLNLKPTHSILSLLRDVKRVDAVLARQALVQVEENFAILAGPNQLLATVSSSTHDVARVIDILKQVADVLILDIPCTYDDIYFETLAAATQVFLIGEQKLTSIRAMKMVYETINRPPEASHLVINRYDSKNKAFAVDRLLKPIGATTLRTVARDDESMVLAMGEATTLRACSPRSPALADITRLANEVIDPELRPQRKPLGLFRRIGQALSNS